MNRDPSHASVTGVIPINQMIGDDEEDTKLLLGMLEAARLYLLSFSWCKSLLDSYFGDGVGGVVAIFLFRIEPAQIDVDEWLWVIVGDIPPAYLVVDTCKNPLAALQSYISQMRKWVELAKQGRSSKEVIPVSMPVTPKWASKLQVRLDSLEQVFVPMFTSRRSITASTTSRELQ